MAGEFAKLRPVKRANQSETPAKIAKTAPMERTSWNTKELPDKPPSINRNTKPTPQNKEEVNKSGAPYKLANHLKTLIPVGMAMI